MTRAEQQEHLMRRMTSAYMLVYYRESELDKILPTDDSLVESAIPEHIPKQIEFEIAERERLEKQRQEELYYTTAKLVTTATINAHVGFDLALDRTVHKFYDEELEGTACDPVVLKVKRIVKCPNLSSQWEKVWDMTMLTSSDWLLFVIEITIPIDWMLVWKRNWSLIPLVIFTLRFSIENMTKWCFMWKN